MSFKNDYKSAFGSVSPDTEKIIAEVRNKLNENAPIKIQAEQKKKPVWTIIGPVAGAAACIALAAFVAVRIAPNFLQDGAYHNAEPENYSIQADATGATGTSGAGRYDNNTAYDGDLSGESASTSMISSESSESYGGIIDPHGRAEPKAVDIGNGMTLTGTPLDNSELEEFSVNIGDDYLTEAEIEFIESLEIPELKDLYKRTWRLTCYSLSPNDVDHTDATWENDRFCSYIECIRESKGWSDRFYETGYTYESFLNEYLSTFTKETTEEMFREYDVFLDYNGELFCGIGAKGGWLGGVRWEYELISKSDTVIEFR